MKRSLTILLLLLLVSLSCLCIPGNQGSSEGEGRCGDGVCEKPEDAQRCPQDCGGEPPDEGVTKTPLPVVKFGDTDQASVGKLSANIILDRQMSTGNCGIDPWRSAACQEIGPSYWWGQHLEASVQINAAIIPMEEGRWLITNMSETLVQYDIDPSLYPSKQTGAYDVTTIDFSITPLCSGTISGNVFSLEVSASTNGYQIELVMTADPSEVITGECNGVPFSQNPKHLLYGWAAAVSGNPLDLTAVMSDQDRITAGTYEHKYVTDTNPSPQNRDHVEATMRFTCLSESGEEGTVIGCPWE